MTKPTTDRPPRMFTQHGVTFADARSGSGQWVGRCPFCLKDGHFYLNPDTSAWDCKSCGVSGGHQEFLRRTVAAALAAFQGKPAIALARSRGLSIGALRRAGFGYNVLTDRYIVPVPYADEAGGIWDVRHGRLAVKKNGTSAIDMWSTAGCTVGLLGWGQLETAKTVWIVEGEWDYTALKEEMLRSVKSTDAVVAVPGAGTFKGEWVQLFTDKRVRLAYDHDAKGRAGATKAWNALRPVACDVQAVHWPDGAVEGYDVRDLYLAKRAGALSQLIGALRDRPPGAESVVDTPATASGSRLDGPGLPAADVIMAYRRWLHIPDPMLLVLDAVFGAAIANRIEGDPLWMFLIGPPGTLKTELLMSLVGAPLIEYTDTLTAPGLISGAMVAGGGDPSLLAKFNGRGPGRNLIIEDFTTVLGLPEIARTEIFGILRAAYNGKAKRSMGNMTKEFRQLAFGILAGVTPIIEQYTSRHAALGERFLGIHVPLERGVQARRDYLKRAHGNVGREIKMRVELAAVASQVLGRQWPEIPRMGEDVTDRIISLAQAVAVLRGTVTRERYSAAREVTHKPVPELGTRLVKQLTKAALGVTMFWGEPEVGARGLAIARAYAIGSIPSTQREFVEVMYRGDRGREWTSREVSAEVGLPDYPTGQRVLQDLTMLGALHRSERGRDRAGDRWRIEDDMLEVLEESRLFDG